MNLYQNQSCFPIPYRPLLYPGSSPFLLPRRSSGCTARRMLLQEWVFLVTLWVLIIISHGSADSGEVLGYGMPSPTACATDPCHPLLSPPPPSVSGYPSYGRPPPPSPLSGYPSYGAPPPPRPVSGYPSYGRSPPPPSPPLLGYPSYGAPPPSPPLLGYPSYGAPPPPIRLGSPSTPGQGCTPPVPPTPPAPVQCCLYSPPATYEYLPNQNYSAPSAPAFSWFSVMALSLFFALLLL